MHLKGNLGGLASACALAVLSACGPQAAPTHPAATPSSTEAPASATATPITPKSFNPLTGEPVADPSLLRIPAVLISISHFPAIARPQAGLSFAPFVYEFYITEGATRYLAVFYGQFPSVALPISGGCEVRSTPLQSFELTIGNFVWLDSNGNGVQDAGEHGISGLCINLLDKRGYVVDTTTTDSNGYYGFDVRRGDYIVQFVAPPYLTFTRQHASAGGTDSDADAQTGRATIKVDGNDLSIDAGLKLVPGAPLPTATDTAEPLARVGPIRSGRLLYRHIAAYFESSCLIFGSASPEVLVKLPKCLTVFHQISGGGFMLNIDQMLAVARENQHKRSTQFDYSGNIFVNEAPASASVATELREYWAYQNQSGWIYDSASQSYWRYVDTSIYTEAGILHPEVDRLTRRQLEVQNIILLFAKHEVISPTNLDIHLDPGRTGKAILMRNGRMYDISWATTSKAEMEHTALRPIRFLQPDGTPALLKPGHTWIIVVTPETTLEEKTPGHWRMVFAQPPGAK